METVAAVEEDKVESTKTLPLEEKAKGKLRRKFPGPAGGGYEVDKESDFKTEGWINMIADFNCVRDIDDIPGTTVYQVRDLQDLRLQPWTMMSAPADVVRVDFIKMQPCTVCDALNSLFIAYSFRSLCYSLSS